MTHGIYATFDSIKSSWADICIKVRNVASCLCSLPETILLNSITAKAAELILCLMLKGFLFILVKYKFLCCLSARFIWTRYTLNCEIQ